MISMRLSPHPPSSRITRLCPLLLCLGIHVLPFYVDAFTRLPLRPTRRSLSAAVTQDGDLDPNNHSWMVPAGVSFGSLDKLEWHPMMMTNTTTTETSTTLCTVSTRAIGLNFADIFCILGLYSAANEIRQDNNNKAFCPGLEYAGIVLDDPSHTFTPGQRVLGFTRFGAYADVVQVPPHFLYPLPSNWTFIQGAGFIVQALTAWHGLVEIGRMPVVADDANNNNDMLVVLIHSAAGGVGLWASEIAARRGALVIGVVGSDTKAKAFEDRILPLSPCSRVMVRGEERTFGQRLAQLLGEIHSYSKEISSLPSQNQLEYLRKEGQGIDIVMESLGGQYFSESFEALNRGGALVTFGSTSYVSPGLNINKIRLIWRYLTRPKIDPGTLTSRNIRLAGFNLIYLTDMPKQLRRELRECILCLSGINETDETSEDYIPLDTVTPPIIGDVFDFRTETIQALERLKSGATIGKVVLDNQQIKSH